MVRITSREFQKEFGRYRTEAHKGAVIITNHSREDVVLISAEEYHRLRQLDQQAFYAHELPKEVINEMGAAAIAEETRQYDHEYKSD